MTSTAAWQVYFRDTWTYNGEKLMFTIRLARLK